MDLAIAIGIWVCGIGLALVGIEMTITPPSAKRPTLKWIYRIVFGVLGLVFIVLNIWQTERTNSREAGAEAERQQEQRTSESNLKYMQGELDSINKMLSVLASNSSPQQLAAALAKATSPAQLPPNTDRRLTEQQRTKIVEEFIEVSWAEIYDRSCRERRRITSIC